MLTNTQSAQTTEERSKLSFRFDREEKCHVASVFNFDGPDGILVLDKRLLIAGGRERGLRLFVALSWRLATVAVACDSATVASDSHTPPTHLPTPTNPIPHNH